MDFFSISRSHLATLQATETTVDIPPECFTCVVRVETFDRGVNITVTVALCFRLFLPGQVMYGRQLYTDYIAILYLIVNLEADFQNSPYCTQHCNRSFVLYAVLHQFMP